MTQPHAPQQAVIVPDARLALPALFAPDAAAARRFVEFFTANIRNPNTRKAYARAVAEFAAWCERHGLHELRDIEPVQVATYVETLQARLAAPSVKLHLAAIRMLFDWLVVGQVVAVNLASAVRGPKHSVRKGKTPVLTAEEARALLDAIDPASPLGLRDRALIALMVYTFARVGAALKMRVEDVYVQGRRAWVRLHEKGGKRHEMPCHHNLDAYLHAYIDGAGLGADPKGFLFRSASRGRTHRPPPEPGRRLAHDPPPRRRGGRHDENRQPQLSSHGYHRIPAQRRQAGDCPADGQSRKRPHHWPL
jgi:site-specific recombinase XerD